MINAYRPRMAPAHWFGIREFVIAAAHDTGAPNEKWALDLLAFLSRYVLWAWQTAGLPLTRTSIFDISVIDRYTGAFIVGSAKTKQLSEARLRRVAEALGSPASPRTMTVGITDARPYLPSDLPGLFSWAAEQRTPRTRQDAWAVLGFSGGAGLRGTELAEVRRCDVHDNPDGISVHVRGEFPRLISVRSEWEAAARRAIQDVTPEAFVAIPHGKPENRARMLSNFGRRAQGHAPRVARLRVTWVMHYLDVLPMGALLKAAGYKTPASLRRYVELADSPDDDELFTLLKSGDTRS